MDVPIIGSADRLSKNEGMLAFSPWCARCNRRIRKLEQVHEGSRMTAWKAWCHGDTQVMELYREAQLETQKDANGDEVYVGGAKVKNLIFFAPEAQYGGAREKWTELSGNGVSSADDTGGSGKT